MAQLNITAPVRFVQKYLLNIYAAVFFGVIASIALGNYLVGCIDQWHIFAILFFFACLLVLLPIVVTIVACFIDEAHGSVYGWCTLLFVLISLILGAFYKSQFYDFESISKYKAVVLSGGETLHVQEGSSEDFIWLKEDSFEIVNTPNIYHKQSILITEMKAILDVGYDIYIDVDWYLNNRKFDLNEFVDGTLTAQTIDSFLASSSTKQFFCNKAITEGFISKNEKCPIHISWFFKDVEMP